MHVCMYACNVIVFVPCSYFCFFPGLCVSFFILIVSCTHVQFCFLLCHQVYSSQLCSPCVFASFLRPLCKCLNFLSVVVRSFVYHVPGIHVSQLQVFMVLVYPVQVTVQFSFGPPLSCIFSPALLNSQLSVKTRFCFTCLLFWSTTLTPISLQDQTLREGELRLSSLETEARLRWFGIHTCTGAIDLTQYQQKQIFSIPFFCLGCFSTFFRLFSFRSLKVEFTAKWLKSGETSTIFDFKNEHSNLL